MGIFTRLGIAAFIAANAKILFRLVVSSAIILIFNVLYSKYEALLLATNPEKLFIPLYIYTAIVISLIVWTLLSFRWFSSFREAEKKLEVTNSYRNKPDEYEKITSILNGLSNQASLVINNEKIPKISKISFHTIDKKRVIFIVENEDGTTTNRLVETPENIELRDLNIISEFLNKFTNNQSSIQIEKNIKIFLQEAQNEINKTTKILLEQGVKINKNFKSEKFFVRGLPSLVNSKIDTDLDTLNELLSEIETGKMASKMIKALKKSKGVQIFIGSNTNLFKNANLSMIFSNYQTKNGLTGAIGVIGPKRIDYQRIVPIVNYMSEIISNKK